MESYVKLKKLISDIEWDDVRGNKEVEIMGISSHSKKVGPGYLFIAKKGAKEDGALYIEEAISNGAVAILTDYVNPFLKEIVQLIHPHPEQIEGLLASRFYDDPARSLFMVGITGTSGKTTTSYLVKHLFEALKMPMGLIGTVEYLVGRLRFQAERTTPDVVTNQKLLREMVKEGCLGAVLEVTSHALAQNRVEGIAFDAAIFTNLHRDHLDYHLTMEEYAETKSRLFSSLGREKWAIVNGDSPWIPVMLKQCTSQVLTYGLSPKNTLYAHEIELTPEGTSFSVTYGSETGRFFWKKVGRFNIYNCLAALGVCLTKGFPLQLLIEPVSTFPQVTGRLEKVENLKGLHIYVDYAHKPDALENVLTFLREIKKTGRLITIFGCGGERDRGKRGQMGAIATRYSDFTWITSDNPRSEDPLAICREIEAGVESSHYQIEPDRREAIQKAIERAQSDDLILIAGKGHETYQVFLHQTVPFDDRKVAQEVVRQLC